MFIKKILLSVIYSTLFYGAYNFLFKFAPMELLPQIIIVIICTAIICIISYSLRTGSSIKKMNFVQEIRDQYNESFKRKFQFITKSKEFKSECICCAVTAVVIPTIIALAQIRSADQLSRNLGRLFGLAAAILIFGIILDFVVWLLAYNKSFKKKIV